MYVIPGCNVGQYWVQMLLNKCLLGVDVLSCWTTVGQIVFCFCGKMETFRKRYQKNSLVTQCRPQAKFFQHFSYKKELNYNLHKSNVSKMFLERALELLTKCYKLKIEDIGIFPFLIKVKTYEVLWLFFKSVM